VEEAEAETDAEAEADEPAFRSRYDRSLSLQKRWMRITQTEFVFWEASFDSLHQYCHDHLLMVNVVGEEESLIHYEVVEGYANPKESQLSPTPALKGSFI